MIHDFKLADDLPPNGTLIQASAGTGKTYSVAALVTLAIAEDPTLRIGNVLVTTYTRNAAAELRERIRDRMLATARLLRDKLAFPGGTPDPLDERLLADQATRAEKARRLERAVAEFDTATIGTMHSICAAVLRMGGVPAADTGDSELLDRVIAEVVNDAIVTETSAATAPAANMPCGDGSAEDAAAECGAGQPRWRPDWNEGHLRDLVKKNLGDPFIVPWFHAEGRTDEQQQALERAMGIVQQCVAVVQARMMATPSYDDLLRRARDEVKGDEPRTKSFRETLQAKYRLGIVDEAQDTSRLQWEFLHLIFPPAVQDRRLIAVGDPKQAIYGFRGADVTAYLRFAQQRAGTSGEAAPQRTLRVNRRSDGLLLRGLNAIMAGAAFGPGIAYEEVAPAEERKGSRVQGLHPVEFVNCGESSLVEVAVAKVHELLTTAAFLDGRPRPFRPGEICLLCRLNDVGNAIASGLRRLAIPAVTTGTATVMAGQTAEDLRSLFEAMERPSDAGRARRAAATAFFGRPLTSLPPLSDEELQDIQEVIAQWHGVLQGKGVAAMAGRMMAETEVAKRLASGREGERRVVDFGHVVELLHDASGGRGCPARVVLEHVTALARKDATSDTVSRRVESDEDAVRIMTVHMAKGLQFPAVVVVDGWRAKREQHQQGPAVFYDGDDRRLDVGLALDGVGNSSRAKQSVTVATNEDRCRLLYVAVTRPEHHVSILRQDDWQDSLVSTVMPGAPASADGVPPAIRDAVGVREVADLRRPAPWTPPKDKNDEEPPARGTAPLPPKVEQVYRRTSFSDIKKAAAGASVDHHLPVGQGYDEEPVGGGAGDAGLPVGDVAAETEKESATEPARIRAFTIEDLPGGKAFGTTVHEIFERLDVGPGQSAAEVAEAVGRLVDEVAVARQLQQRKAALTAMIVDALHTPFGGPSTAALHNLRFIDFPKADRLVEMDFEMGLAGIDRGVLASDVGRLLGEVLPKDDPLYGYASHLARKTFDVPLAGLINGQIDAVLRVPGRPADDPRLIIADYKTNRLHRAEDTAPLAAYAHGPMAAEMSESDYPLQALIYGTALWRMLRWRLGPRKPAGWDPAECIAGIVYAFVRGMKGADTPVDAAGRRYGVFIWQPPPELWWRLSGLLAGKLAGVRS